MNKTTTAQLVEWAHDVVEMMRDAGCDKWDRDADEIERKLHNLPGCFLHAYAADICLDYDHPMVTDWAR